MSETRTELIIRLIEVTLVGLTLIVTVGINWMIFSQTKANFKLERSSSYTERFNSADMKAVRHTADIWLKNKETPEQLFNRVNSQDSILAEQGYQTIQDLKIFANFFQELGTALKYKSVDKEYMFDNFGGLVTKYHQGLKPFIEKMREKNKQKSLYDGFEELYNKVKANKQ